MPVVTRITQQKDKNRANVYLNGKFAFGISLEAVLKHGLKRDKELSQEFIDNLRDEAEEEKVYGRILRFAILRPRSQKEIELWLKRKKVLPTVARVVFNRLKKLKFIDDANFARWWIEQRVTFRPRSKKMIILELRQKGIRKELIEEALVSADIPEEVDVAKKLVDQKLATFRRYTSEEKIRKISSFLTRRGFSWETIKRVIDQKQIK